MSSLIVPFIFILAIISTIIALLLSFVMVVAWWVLVYCAIKGIYKMYVAAKIKGREATEELARLMTDDIPKFLWYIVAPFLLLLYILCVLLHTDKQDSWILIFQITPIAD